METRTAKTLIKEPRDAQLSFSQTFPVLFLGFIFIGRENEED